MADFNLFGTERWRDLLYIKLNKTFCSFQVAKNIFFSIPVIVTWAAFVFYNQTLFWLLSMLKKCPPKGIRDPLKIFYWLLLISLTS
uniref:Putative ovule protein n=1 Tax=Solanum chacoense TaxID=4108 RepID=A0A0V0HKQ4_SOLCH